MKAIQDVEVAVLLATFNGARYVSSQINSLKDNATPFRIHWLDDHSTDNTRAVVRDAALEAKLALVEWHQPKHQGIPAAFFQLLECAEADIYLFCDQDDIWQPGKIDATVANLLPDIHKPVLCFSDPWILSDGESTPRRRFSEVAGSKAEDDVQESRLFMPAIVAGNTQGFTRPLREIYMAHRVIARSHALMHDAWMHVIGTASGTVRFLHNVPTTLYRRHENNVTSGAFLTWKGGSDGRIVITQRQHQLTRALFAREAVGFLLAADTLPPSPKLERLMPIARLVSKLDKRQSLAALLRLTRRGAMYPSKRLALGFSMACLWSDATVN